MGIALLRILRLPNFGLLPPIDREPLLESRFNTDIPASAPTDNLLLPLRPIISEIEKNYLRNLIEPENLIFYNTGTVLMFYTFKRTC